MMLSAGRFYVIMMGERFIRVYQLIYLTNRINDERVTVVEKNEWKISQT